MDRNKYDGIPGLEDPARMFDLDGRVGLITGGTGKMGQQFARTLAKAGATVIIADLSKEKSTSVANVMKQETKRNIIGTGCDVTQQKDVEDLFSQIEKENGRLDFLINNVMGKPDGYYSPFDEYSKATWDKVMEINLTGCFLCCQEATKIMKRQASGGSIVITASTYGIVGPDQRIYDGCSPGSNPYGGHYKLNAPASYSASKAGLIGLSKYLATLLGPDGIRVNVFTPGGVYDGQEESFHSAYVNRVPLGRMATWSDYNGAILFLASDASRYMTGANIVIDGGWTAW
jgi:NAD(P)-dependent dehydrogenase (short-subunit alcohol dehydrogenase family)